MTHGSEAPVRLAHLSDIHVPFQPLDWAWSDWLNKRATGWFNMRCLGRGKRFEHAARVVKRLMAGLLEHRPDRVIFTGDASHLGFPEEFSNAANLLRVGKPDGLPGLAVPGNHDYYIRKAEASGAFERAFAPWQEGERFDGQTYPFAQRVGDLWLVGVNSSTGNRHVWDASGGVGRDQLDRLEKLLGRLSRGPRILVTHYPICLKSGEPEKRYHCLRNLKDLVAVAIRGGISLWLHGHRHTSYHLQQTRLTPFPVICIGSSTQIGKWAYGEYRIEGNELQAVRRVYSPATDEFVIAEQFKLQLPESNPRRSSAPG